MNDLDQHYRRLFPIIRSKCLRLVGNTAEAEEIAQETFIRLWRAGKGQDPPREALAWAHTTATRLAIDRLRRRKRRRTIPLEDRAVQSQTHVRLILRELARDVPEDQLAAVLMHRIDGIPQEQIATSLGCTARTIRRWITEFDARYAEAS